MTGYSNLEKNYL